MAAESLFLCLIQFIIIIMILVAVGCMLMWGINIGLIAGIITAPFATPFGITSIIYLLIFIAILIPCIWFEYMLMRVMNLSTPPLPGIPGCFAEDTLIELLVTDNDNKNTKKLIKDICIGDILKNGSKVTAILKCSAKEQNLYTLNNVLVTGEHRVFHLNKWIKVKDHPKILNFI